MAFGIGGAIYAESKRAEVMRRAAKSAVVLIAESPVETALGSGTVVGASNGYVFVLSCHHVIEDMRTIEVYFAGGHTHGFIEKDSPERDLVLLYAKADLPALPIAAAPPSLYDTVYVLGAPDGESGSASEGMVTKLSFAIEDGEHAEQRFYRVTNAFMLPGISGGTATNTEGELIGVPVRAAKGTPQQGLLVAWPDVKEFTKEYVGLK
jgi:S1-C subfamily serine protease